jgi:ATP-binding cassette subfamily B protein
MTRIHPLARLWSQAVGHRGQVISATLLSVGKKITDIAPEILIGGAVDVVVRRDDSFLASFGITDVTKQMLVLWTPLNRRIRPGGPGSGA